jgi:hypothetical protein
MVTSRQCRVLEMLADAGECGCNDSAFVARFLLELLDLVREEFATVEREVKILRGWPIEFARIKVTDAGLEALEECISSTTCEGMHRARLTDNRPAPRNYRSAERHRRCGAMISSPVPEKGAIADRA